MTFIASIGRPYCNAPNTVQNSRPKPKQQAELVLNDAIFPIINKFEKLLYLNYVELHNQPHCD